MHFSRQIVQALIGHFGTKLASNVRSLGSLLNQIILEYAQIDLFTPPVRDSSGKHYEAKYLSALMITKNIQYAIITLKKLFQNHN